MIRKVNVLAGTGLTGNGKSSLFDLLAVCLNAFHPLGRIMRAEMSGVIKYGLGLHSRLGDSVRKYKSLMDNGGFLPDDVALPLLENWLQHATSTNPNLQTLLFTGLPRTLAQKQKLKEYFLLHCIVDQKVKPKIASFSVNKRVEISEEKREDDLKGESAFAFKLTEFETHTLPMLRTCNGERVLIDREQPLEERIKIVFKKVRSMKEPVIPHSETKRALNRLRSGTHCIHTEIDNLTNRGKVTPKLVAFIT